MRHELAGRDRDFGWKGLPFTTTLLEIEVIGTDANHPLLVQTFPAVYHFTE